MSSGGSISVRAIQLLRQSATGKTGAREGAPNDPEDKLRLPVLGGGAATKRPREAPAWRRPFRAPGQFVPANASC
jgi:hypothetical protein